MSSVARKSEAPRQMRTSTEAQTPDPLAIARDYLKRGWHPIPLPYGTKFPPDDAWQHWKIADTNVHEFFNSGKQNIGVQLGPKSNGLADVDLDCSEAVLLARTFLPPTDSIFGRKSKPAAHYLYRVADPDPTAKIGHLDENGKMICELRLGGGGKGAQTMFPGSLHSDNESVEWENDGLPSEATCAVLKQACIKIAIGTLLKRHWPIKKGRHEGALRLGGFLARAGWQFDDIAVFVSTIAAAAEDEEWKDRERAACDSYEAHERGEPVAGFPKLVEYFGEEVAKQIAHILNYRETDTGELLERMNEKYCVVPISGKVRVATWEEERQRQVPVFYTFQDFRGLLNNKKVRRATKKDTDAVIGVGSWWLDHTERRQYDGLVFKPDQPSIIDNRLNLWRGWAITPCQGSWRLLLRHIYKVLAHKEKASFKYIIKWVAWAFQNPEKQAEVALVFRGGRGTGRGLFGRWLKDAFGQHGIHISSREYLVGRFNAHMMDCALLFADEAYWPGDKQAEGILKRCITEPTLQIEKKTIDIFEVSNALKIIIASNEKWVVPAGIDERRFAMFNVSEVHKQDRKYFTALYGEMEAGSIAAMMYDLLAMDLKDWHPRDDVPQTKALHEQKEQSLSAADQWWLGLLQTGELPGPNDKRNPLLAVSKALFEHARATVFRLRYCTPNELGHILKNNGCDRKNNWRIDGQRAWQFPPLKDAREAWDKRIGMKTDWEEAAEWEHPDGCM